MKYEWDEEKNINNFEKHKVWFEEAQAIWIDEKAREFYDHDHSDTEERWVRIGVNSMKGILVAFFCERDNGESIRIISARTATADEKMFYWFGENYEK